MITNAITITVERTGKTYHTLKDWGFAIENTDYLGAPELETHLVNVPGLSRTIDMSDALTGYPVYTHRLISVVLGGLRKDSSWDGVISDIRNILHGQMIKLTFDNDKGYYWHGRAQVIDFERTRRLGKVKLELPTADPYKYEMEDSTEPWKWDPFNFQTGVISQDADVTVSGTATYTLRARGMPISPTFLLVRGTVTVSYKGETHELALGDNRFPDFYAYNEEAVYTFEGTGTLQVIYRRGSL